MFVILPKHGQLLCKGHTLFSGNPKSLNPFKPVVSDGLLEVMKTVLKKLYFSVTPERSYQNFFTIKCEKTKVLNRIDKKCFIV